AALRAAAKHAAAEVGVGQRGTDLVATTPEPGRGLAPTRVRYLVLAAACGLAVLTYIQRLGFSNGLPEIKQQLGLNDTQTSDLASAFLLAYGLFQVPGGLLGDRLGGRHLLTILVLAWSALTGVVAVAADLPAGTWLPFAFL